MVFGYNDLVWILSVIVWTIGITAIIMYIIKEEEELHGLLNVNMTSSQTRLISFQVDSALDLIETEPTFVDFQGY